MSEPFFIIMTLQEAKKELYALRNGIMADYLRKAGDAHPYIFGVSLAQIIELARTIGHDGALARALWNDGKCRESQILALTIMPAEDVDLDFVKTIIADIPNVEIADIACHRLLRNLPFAWQLAEENAAADNTLRQYIALRLLVNLDAIGKIKNHSDLVRIVEVMPDSPQFAAMKQDLLSPED